MIPELVEKFQSFIDDWTKGVQELVDEIFGEENENENEPILVSNTMYCETLIRTSAYYLLPRTWNNYASMIYKADVRVFNNTITVNTTPLGRFAGAKTYWQNLGGNAEACETALNAQTINTYDIVKEHDEDVFVSYGTYDATLSLYYGSPPSYHDEEIHRVIEDENGSVDSTDGCYVRFNDITYTIDNDGYVVVDSTDLDPYVKKMVAIKTHPVVMTCNEPTTITRYITDSGSTNNYHTTYTTTGGDTIDVYYGDSYIIVNNNDNNTSYDDLKNILDIAVTQINDDNDTDIKVPTYRENKYGPEPPEPPEPVTDDDYVDMGLGVETDGMAMYNMAVVTRDELIQLITDFEANADTGLSFIPHVLGLYKLGFESSQLLTTTSDKIRLHKEPSKTAFNSADNYNIVQNQEVLIDCGSITIDREELLTNTFLDFSPYTTYEMFIPGCGWITLPDTVVGRTISVSIVFDLTTCSCKGVVRSEGKLLGGSGTTLATVNGIIGSSVPLSINETGLQRAAIMNGSTQATMALGTAFMGVGIGNPYMGASGVAMAASALASNHIAGNSTYTSTKGGATDYSVFGDGWKAVLKITRPVLEIPDNYGHSVGFVVNRYAQLSEFSGFTVCVNPHIHISATSDEKEEIKRLLEDGVILPEGE